MIVFLNGRFVPEDQALVSAFDRGFLYGDGLFESIRVHLGAPFRWEEHLSRFEKGAAFLGIALPVSPLELRNIAEELLARNQWQNGLLRLTLSRGVGLRGYSPQGANQPTLMLSLHALPALNPQHPPQWRVITSGFRLPALQALALAKTANKLTQIMARSEADHAGVEEAFVLNTNGCYAEATTSNLFWIRDGLVMTPPLASGALPGVTRNLILELCPALGLDFKEANIDQAGLFQSEGVFLSLTTLGIAEVIELDGRRLARSHLTNTLRQAVYEAMGIA